jgi:fructose-1,6-bisphosphatase/inositol monophosphatase family enzyme
VNAPGDVVSPQLVDLVARTGDAVVAALQDWVDWGLSGARAGQYVSDLTADRAAHEVLDAAGVGVLSEESGVVRSEADVLVIIDPLDGSTNASRRLSWWATSICAIDGFGPAASLVVDLVHGHRYTATRGQGALRDGEPIRPSKVTDPTDAMVGISGLPPRSLGWRQFRALGAAALDLCAVADGRLDAYVDCSPDAHGVWDYAGALLVCREAGATIVDALGRDLIVADPDARRTPVAAATSELCTALVANRKRAFAASAG